MICRNCKIDKDSSEFYYRNDSKKHRTECKICTNYNNGYREKMKCKNDLIYANQKKDKMNAVSRNKFLNDSNYKSKRKEQQKLYNKTEKGKLAKSLRDKRYREKNKEVLKERRKTYDAKYRASDKYKNYYESYFLNNEYRKKQRDNYAIMKVDPSFREVRNKANRKYHKTEKGKETSRRNWKLRDLRMRGSGSINWSDIEGLLIESNGLCHYCMKPLDGTYEIDHKIPVSKGGTSIKGNLAISCSPCNRSKQAMTNIEFIDKISSKTIGVIV
ncbi:hypothetical protein LCGC14_0823390 [marine sediment metagenome]|uniref:HNH nuclease domain-containing protein n=1 Tax=marine sediment metagenome TaxID=412755 RepID=A0A0F9PI54_9ZZZZ